MMPEDRHLTAREAPSGWSLAQLVSVIADRRLLHHAVLAVVVEQVGNAAAAVAVEVELRIGDDVEHQRAAQRLLVSRRESLELVASAVLAEARTFKNPVVGEAVDPFVIAAGVDGQAVARMQYANFFTIFKCSRYRHRIHSYKSNDVGLAQPCDIVPRVAQHPGQQQLGMLAEFGRMAARLTRRRAQ